MQTQRIPTIDYIIACIKLRAITVDYATKRGHVMSCTIFVIKAWYT